MTQYVKAKHRGRVFHKVPCAQCGHKIEIGEIYYARASGYEFCETCFKKKEARGEATWTTATALRLRKQA